MDSPEFAKLFEAARSGTSEEQAALVESFRDYLRKIARDKLGPQRAGQLSASDIVQTAIIDAHRGFDGCRATTRGEFKGWLREILANEIRNRQRYLLSQKRDIRREQAMDGDPGLANEEKSPSNQAVMEEDKERLAAAMAKLPDEYREVITMRQRDQLSFVEIGKRTNRTADSARMLWNRAVQALGKILREPTE